MFVRLNRPLNKQIVRNNLTPIIAVKDEHIRIVRRVNMKNAWGGEDIKTLTPEEHRVLCECVALSLIILNDKGHFVLNGLGASFLEEHDNNISYAFFDGKEVLEINDHYIHMMITASYTGEHYIENIGNEAEKEIVRALERIGFVGTRPNGDAVDFYITKKGNDFLINEGYMLG